MTTPENYVMALDQGTTGTRAIMFDEAGDPIAQAYRRVAQYYPASGWVEQDLNEIYASAREVMAECIERSRVEPNKILCLGISNQRETFGLWDSETGEPSGRAIGWQCRRSAAICRIWEKAGLGPLVRTRTGLRLDPYFSASKLCWLLRERPELRTAVQRGTMRCGTVDSWLLWKLTGGRTHATDVTNASRTMLFDIHQRRWDPELLDALGLQEHPVLPRVCDSGGEFGGIAAGQALPEGTPILAVMGDQQAALYGQTAFAPNEGKVTYGTGCFLLLNRGVDPKSTSSDYLLTLAADADGHPVFAWEGSVFHAGSVLQWLRDEAGVLADVDESDALARSVENTGGVHFVPAFTGLGAPYWVPGVRAAITGIERGTTRAHLVRAGLEGIAYQVVDLFERMKEAAGHEKIQSLRVDGGASRNDFLMQFQADMLQLPLERPHDLEVTARGAALLAGRMSGLWADEAALRSQWHPDRVFVPGMKPRERERLYSGWRTAVDDLLSRRADRVCRGL